MVGHGITRAKRPEIAYAASTSTLETRCGIPRTRTRHVRLFVFGQFVSSKRNWPLPILCFAPREEARLEPKKRISNLLTLASNIFQAGSPFGRCVWLWCAFSILRNLYFCSSASYVHSYICSNCSMEGWCAVEHDGGMVECLEERIDGKTDETVNYGWQNED